MYESDKTIEICCWFTYYIFETSLPEYQWLTLVLATTGKIGASSAFAVLFLYSGEIFPTVIRNTALGIGTFFARAGGMIAPYLVNLVIFLFYVLLESADSSSLTGEKYVASV